MHYREDDNEASGVI